MKKLRFYIAAIRWLWQNRTWKSCRQKWKAFDRAMNVARWRPVRNHRGCGWRCSLCGDKVYTTAYFLPDVCPGCGRPMEKETSPWRN